MILLFINANKYLQKINADITISTVGDYVSSVVKTVPLFKTMNF